MTNKPSYAVIVSTRNGASTIRETLNSILGQTIEPVEICVVDDGSTDDTALILGTFHRERKVRILTKPDEGYDIRRVPSNFNLAHANLYGTGALDYLMISGDDCIYPENYADSIISRMASDGRIVVASGRPRTGGDVLQEHFPSGSGRMIRYSFWRLVGAGYPVKVGWETWLLYKGLKEGYRTELYEDLIYEHLRPRGSMHEFSYWGSAMYCLGYHPLYALGRVAKNLAKMEITMAGGVNMLGGYLMAFLGSSDPFISAFEQPFRRFVRASQAGRISYIVSTVARRLSGQMDF